MTASKGFHFCATVMKGFAHFPSQTCYSTTFSFLERRMELSNFSGQVLVVLHAVVQGSKNKIIWAWSQSWVVAHDNELRPGLGVTKSCRVACLLKSVTGDNPQMFLWCFSKLQTVVCRCQSRELTEQQEPTNSVSRIDKISRWVFILSSVFW